jgi:hypothetical protein
LVTDTNKADADTKGRNIADNTRYRAVGHLLKKKYITQPLKAFIYETTIRLDVDYGAECWTQTNKMERATMICERKVMRKV